MRRRYGVSTCLSRAAAFQFYIKPEAHHAIQKQLHSQLLEYWREHPHLKIVLEDQPFRKSLAKSLAEHFMRGRHGFVPLVRKQEDSFCALNILFLRRDIPGKIVSGGGDLDNRLKTLFGRAQGFKWNFWITSRARGRF